MRTLFETQRGAMTLALLQGDITQFEGDAIVNAANEKLLGGGGVDGAIHRAAGPELREYCRELGGCEPGESKVTPAFNLLCKWIIHTVGPRWNGGLSGEPVVLKSCYESATSLAVSKSIRSIAFPAISCGIFGYPREQATEIAVSTIRNIFADLKTEIRVCFTVFDHEMADIYLTELSDNS